MCINPTYVWMERGPKWEKQPVPCRKCWRCKKNRINDYTGRALCEVAVSSVTCTITLSYAPRTDLADKILHPRHFQLFMKMLRRAGHKVRYLVAGEYGELKGRAHFHAVLFFEHLASPPPGAPAPFWNPRHSDDPFSSAPFSRLIPPKTRLHIREWPHGLVFVDWSSDEKSIRYVCKYILSDDKNRAWFSMSKKPTLGSAWFSQKAQTARAHNVLPSAFAYRPPGSTSNQTFMVTGATRRDYLNAITTDRADLPRMSEWTAKSFEKYERQREAQRVAAMSADELLEHFRSERDERIRRADEEAEWARLREIEKNDELIRSSCDGIGRPPKK